WVSDPNAKYAADVEVADKQKAILLVKAKEKISFWTTELQLGIISDEDKTSLIAWIWYIKALQEVDTSKAPDITWPAKPA
ncbi:tail fiber assembly protein, partial [Escherichia coli]|nr:tail fiber assembly protein [Escherichia coli]